MNTLGGETIMAWCIDLVSSFKCYLIDNEKEPLVSWHNFREVLFRSDKVNAIFSHIS